ncbi:MAG: hypothetical protein R3A44_20785 [Caldilineaceae bacterium]
MGRAANIRVPVAEPGLWAVEYKEQCAMEDIPSGPHCERIVEETEEDLTDLVETFEELGVVVRRPEPMDHAQVFATPDWQSDGQQNYCPRDLFVAIGNWIIEAPMTLRSRHFETLAYREIMLSYLKSGCRWISAPKPRLLDDMYMLDMPTNGHADGRANGHASLLNQPNSLSRVIREYEPVFDAANILRIGRDILYLVSDTGNRLGAQWLQTILGSEFKVHPYENVYNGSHVDTTITLVRPGLVVVNAERVGPHNLPALFDGWDVIYLDEVVDIGFSGPCTTSKWIGMNFMMVNQNLAIVDALQTPLIRELAKRKVDVIPLRLRHARTLAGGFHCVTLDVRRRGGLETYC